MTAERLLSVAIAFGVVVYAAVLQPNSLILAAIIQTAFPLAAIWYHEEISDMTGSGKFESTTPAIFIRILGWVLLLLTPTGVWGLKFRLELAGH